MQQSNSQEIVKLFWTGGWDSTFRLVELSREKNTVQPIYIYGDGRPSASIELRTMNKIIDVMKQKDWVQATILPILFVNYNEIIPVENITASYLEMKKILPLGSQYEWLAWYAHVNPGIEIGITYSDSMVSRILRTDKGYCTIKETSKVSKYEIDLEKSSVNANLLFGSWYYPILFRTERDMLKQIHEWGCEDIMEMIWFCHRPIHGKPCGYCHPCQVKVLSDMAFLLPPQT